MSHPMKNVTTPIDNPHLIKFSIFFNEDEYRKLVNGFTPRGTDDRWLVFFDDNHLHIHRSWTGYGTFSAKLTKNENWYVIDEFFVERNAEKYARVDDEFDKHDFFAVISSVVLNTNSRAFAVEQTQRKNKIVLEF
jgi:ADP-ribosyl-[dinitrogen reductase] hydrolase